MTRPVFRAVPLPDAGPYRLLGPEGRHAAAVRRLRAGEELLLVDGTGGSARAVVTASHRDALDLQVCDPRRVPPASPRLTVVQALAKGEHAERAVDLLTEVGADEIVPWAAARSVVRWDGDRQARGRLRWQAVADAAAKQSRRVWWPQVTPLASTAQVAGLVRAADLGVVLHEAAGRPLADVDVAAAGSVVLVVGPEGGIAPEEVDALGAVACRLGPEVLRTSSAGIAAAAALLSRTGRWA
ncbi:MAG TPA: 16S rRNA (uracil(1498)-N(3))-methyltransferase [Mycobacteriales bacterium]